MMPLNQHEHPDTGLHRPEYDEHDEPVVGDGVGKKKFVKRTIKESTDNAPQDRR